MVDWLVIAADRASAGRGVRGNTLLRFLQTYFGQRAVALQSPDQWRRDAMEAETLFLGLPSSLEPQEIAQLKCRRLIAFDYFDRQQLAWTPEQVDVLQERVVSYLKPWSDAAWNYEPRMGLLPIRRYGRLAAAIAIQRLSQSLRRQVPIKLHDVAFLGRPNFVELFQHGKVVESEQRIEWLRSLREEAPDVRLWGGFVGMKDNPTRQQQIEERFSDLSHLEHNSAKVGFPSYYYHLTRSRVVLAPGGNVPWTYRHYEALYSGAVVVSIDFRQREMLVPLPKDGMIHVSDGASVVPAVREALEWSRKRSELAEQNFRHLERYMRLGLYSRRRPELMQRFLTQLE